MSEIIYELSDTPITSNLDTEIRKTRLMDYCLGPEILFDVNFNTRNTLWVLSVVDKVLRLKNNRGYEIEFRPTFEVEEEILAVSFAIGINGNVYIDVETVIGRDIQLNHEFVYTRVGTSLTLLSHNRIDNRKERSYLLFDELQTFCNGVVRFLGSENAIKYTAADNQTEPKVLNQQPIKGYLWQVAKGLNKRIHVLMRPL